MCRDPLPPPIEAPVPTGPATIQDLQALPPPLTENFYAIILKWTVPVDPDDPTEPPWLYEVRYDSRARAGEEWLTAPGVVRRNFSKPPGTTQTLPIGPLTPGKLYFFALRSRDSHEYWSGWSNAVSLTVQNLPPVAAFSLAGDASCPDIPVHFDANACNDPEDRVEALQVRWDWESDGGWDTPWSPTKTVDHAYVSPGRRTVTLQVRDRAGAVSDVAHRSDLLSLTSARQSVVSEERYCCWEEHGHCGQICSYAHEDTHYGPGWWDHYIYTWVSQDSIMFTNRHPGGSAGFMQAAADFRLRICLPIEMHLTGSGALTVEVSSGAGPIFPAGPREPLSDFDFTRTLEADEYLVHIETRNPGSVRLLFSDAPAGLP